MKVTFLGTGSSLGIPVLGNDDPVCLSKNPKDKRLRTSALVEWEDYKFVIDCGPDFRQQLLTQNIDTVNGIFFTHEHTDHVIGFDEVRALGFRQGTVPIYADNRVIKALKSRFYYIFDPNRRYALAPTVEINEVDNDSFTFGDLIVTPIHIMHGKLPILGYRFGDFTYITDAKTISDTDVKKIKGTKVLVVNAVRREPHPSHFNLDEAIRFIQKINPKKAYLTHISHYLGFHDEVEKELPENIHLAYDNLTITI